MAAAAPSKDAQNLERKTVPDTGQGLSYGNPKWKQRGAAKEVRKEGIGSLEARLQACGAIDGTFCGTAVLAEAWSDQADLLERAGYGRLIPGHVPASLLPLCSDPGGTAPSRGGCSARQETGGVQETVVYQFSLEEAFFLCHGLGCLRVHAPDQNGALEHESLWRLCQRSQEGFVEAYVAYAHLRSKRWVVRPGLQYGADLAAYRHHPSFVHSDFAALVVRADDASPRLASWTDVHAMTRLCGTVCKTLLLLHVLQDGGSTPTESLQCLGEFSVESSAVRRWLPEKNRGSLK